jgi:hypothetical protein
LLIRFALVDARRCGLREGADRGDGERGGDEGGLQLEHVISCGAGLT